MTLYINSLYVNIRGILEVPGLFAETSSWWLKLWKISRDNSKFFVVEVYWHFISEFKTKTCKICLLTEKIIMDKLCLNKC